MKRHLRKGGLSDRLWSFVPPTFADWYRSRIPARHQFDSFAESALFCDEVGYQDTELVEVVVEKTRLCSGSKCRQLVFSQSDCLIALAVSCAIRGRADIRILDFGGGAGHHYFTTRKVIDLPPQVTWCVVETPLMADRARFLADGSLCFTDSVSSAVDHLGAVDLVIASGALHYCEDPLALMSLLLDTRPAHFCLARSLNAESELSTYLAQESLLSANGPGDLPSGFEDRVVRYPNSIVPYGALLRLLEQDYEIAISDKSPKPHLRLKSGSASFYSCYAKRKL